MAPGETSRVRSWPPAVTLLVFQGALTLLGVPLSLTGRALFVFLFFGALGGLLGGRLSDRVGRKQVIATSLLIFPPLMAAALALQGPMRWLLSPNRPEQVVVLRAALRLDE